MGGGLLNIISKGSEDIILTGNPKISFFKHVYKKHTNFGLQYFRLDYAGLRSLDYNNETEVTFKIPRYADLLGESYIVLNIPDIYSQPPIYNNKYCPKFKWIRDLGYNMIKKISISIGGQPVNEFSGEYLINLRDREYNDEKREKINNMTGNIPEIYEPASKYNGVYPNSFKSSNFEPSIRGRKLYIPIDCWFGQNSHMNIPLVALQYQVVHIRVLFRPICEMYVVSNELSDEYTENFLFNEFPAMHNVNFMLESPTTSSHANCDGIIAQLEKNFIIYKNNMDAAGTPLFTVNYPSTDPLEKAMQEYTDSVIAFIENGDCELPTSHQHVGTSPMDADTLNLFKIRVHNINYSNFYKVYIYIDTKNITDDDTTKISSGFVNYLKSSVGEAAILVNLVSGFNINENTISFFNSTNVKIDDSTKYFDRLPSGNNTVQNYNNVSQTMPGDICRNNNSNNRFLLQQQYSGVQKREKYAAPGYVAIHKETTFNDSNATDAANTDIYTNQELIGQSQINIDNFTLDDQPSVLNNSWNADIHIISKYVFLDEEERTKMAKQPHSYLIKTIYEEEFQSLLIPNTLSINSKDLVVNYTWAFRRNDAFLRNEWSNYTNWEFIDVPNTPLSNTHDGVNYPFFLTPYIGVGTTNNNNKKTILQSLSIFVDGKMRENLFEQGVYNHLEKYLKCEGRGKDGQYFYSFALHNNPTDLQPSGCMNLSRFKDISFQFTLIDTPDDPSFDAKKATTLLFQPSTKQRSAPICVASVTKKDEIKLYSFDMRTFQERYNVVTFNSGMAGLMYAR